MRHLTPSCRLAVWLALSFAGTAATSGCMAVGHGGEQTSVPSPDRTGPAARHAAVPGATGDWYGRTHAAGSRPAGGDPRVRHGAPARQPGDKPSGPSTGVRSPGPTPSEARREGSPGRPLTGGSGASGGTGSSGRGASTPPAASGTPTRGTGGTTSGGPASGGAGGGAGAGGATGGGPTGGTGPSTAPESPTASPPAATHAGATDQGETSDTRKEPSASAQPGPM